MNTLRVRGEGKVISIPPRGFAGVDVARTQAVFEGRLALGGRTVGPRFGGDVTLRLLLDAVVADGRGSIEGLRDLVAGRGRQVAGLGSMIRPDTGQAISLQLSEHRHALRTGGIVVGLVEQAEQVLHVVAVFMGQHVGLGEGASLRSEAGLQFIEEREVQVNQLVAGTVERASGGRRITAGALGRAGIKDGLGIGVLVPAVGKFAGPVILDAVDVAYDAAVFPRIGIRAGLADRLQVVDITGSLAI